MRQAVYFVPFSESGLQNKLFAPYWNRKANVPPFGYLKAYLEGSGLEVATIDYWSAGKRKDDDVLIVFDHPPVGFYKTLYRARGVLRGENPFPLKNRRLANILPYFKKKILMQWESPVNAPWVYKNIESIVAEYDTAQFIPRAGNLPHFLYPQNFDRLNEEHFSKSPRSKFLIMMNSASRAKGFWKHDLYSKRVEALEFFCRYGEVDLYGARWDKGAPPFVKKIWKGFAEDKPATMSEYRFALCFENAVWPGYLTEKIFDCIQVGTIPVYWGAPDIEEDIPADCFIDMRKFSSGGGSLSAAQDIDGRGVAGGVNYNELRAFLHALLPEAIEAYRAAMRRYFSSEQFKKFTPESFAKTVHEIISQ